MTRPSRAGAGHATSKLAGGSPRYIHELGFYASDEQFRDLICPFAFGGLTSGEPVVFAYDERKVALLREWLPDSPAISYVTGSGAYAGPAKALTAWRDLVETRLDDGAPRVRIAGDVPHEGYGRSFAGWDRYEAAVDRALGDLPIWAPCLYDLRVAPSDVIETATKLHRGLLDADGGHRANPGFDPPAALADFRRPPPDPREQTAPTRTLDDPRPAAVRALIRQLADGLLGSAETDALQLAATEALSNAVVHGEPPVRVSLWADESGLMVHVHDRGDGPADPLVGLLCDGGGAAESGRGLWIVHNMDIDVALIAASDGFTVRLRADRHVEGA